MTIKLILELVALFAISFMCVTARRLAVLAQGGACSECLYLFKVHICPGSTWEERCTCFCNAHCTVDSFRSPNLHLGTKLSSSETVPIAVLAVPPAVTQKCVFSCLWCASIRGFSYSGVAESHHLRIPFFLQGHLFFCLHFKNSHFSQTTL